MLIELQRGRSFLINNIFSFSFNEGIATIIFLKLTFFAISFNSLNEITFVPKKYFPIFLLSSSTKYEILLLSNSKICFANFFPEYPHPYIIEPNNLFSIKFSLLVSK